ncbi:hypothetical protein ACFX2G_047861 [Malus domestica]
MEQEELGANDVTFLSLLYACGHCGKDLSSWILWSKKYGLHLKLEHYTCAVDLLGRSGCLEEAEAMIRSLPVKADAIIWKTLLSAHDSASYVLLSNIHASALRWHDLSEQWEIDLYLKELTSELKLHGYVPDTGSVLHDMNNEEKEYNLGTP